MDVLQEVIQVVFLATHHNWMSFRTQVEQILQNDPLYKCVYGELAAIYSYLKQFELLRVYYTIIL
jgi:Tfp pilus assembly protein PilF